MEDINILMIGDIVGKVGLRTVGRLLPGVVSKHEIDFVVANGENLAGGMGLTPSMVEELLDFGVDCITTGNHVWRQQELSGYIDRQPRVLRPSNFSSAQPGSGVGLFETAAGSSVGVMNLAGRVYMDPADSPFDAAVEAIETLSKTCVILVDFHAEATSEKRAMGFHLDGRVTAVVGTHTHVQTADEQILEGGTAYITDLGMTGPHDSIIGIRKEIALKRFATGMPSQFKVASKGARLQGVVIHSRPSSGKAVGIERLDIPLPD